MLHILSQFVCFFWAICEDQGHFERLTLSKHETCDILPFFELSLFLNTGWKKKSHESDCQLLSLGRAWVLLGRQFSRDGMMPR